MIKYPLTFEVSSKSTSGISSPFEARAEEFPPIAGSIPKQFGGPGTGYSPEDLFALAVISCLIATFKVFAERTKFSFTDITSSAVLTIDRGADGAPELQKLDITFTLTGADDQEKAKALMAESEKYCLVSRATTCEKSISLKFA